MSKDGGFALFGKLALPRCDKCENAWYAKYRKGKPALFYCQKCRRRHPRWTQKQIDQIDRDAKELAAKMRVI